MELREECPPRVGQAFDDVHLPQRVVSIHRPTDDAGHLIGELLGGAGRREPDLADVVVEVEVRVVDPVRVVEPVRHLEHAASQRFDVADHRPEPLAHRVERVEVGVRPLVDREPAHMAVRGRRLHVEERCVQPAQLFHHPDAPLELGRVRPAGELASAVCPPATAGARGGCRTRSDRRFSRPRQVAGSTPDPPQDARLTTDERTVKASNPTSGRAAWLVAAVILAAVTAMTLVGSFGDVTWEQPTLLFTLVTVSAAICIAGATVVIAIADRREMAEIGLLGSALMAASVMPLVHGLVTPGVLYDETAAFRTAAFLSLPIAVAVAAPLLRPHSAFGRWAATRWRDWTLLSLLAVFILGAVVVFFPDAIAAPAAADALTIVVTLAMVAAIGSISRRQLRYYGLGGQSANLMASLSLLALVGTALLPLTDSPYSPGFWWLHLSGALGVIGVCVGLVVSRSFSRSAHDLLGPVLARDPLVAFELGLSPVVHQFVASLEDKDTLTRDHVVRTAEMALRR